MAYTKILVLDDNGLPDVFHGIASAGVTGGNWVVAGSNTLAAAITSSGTTAQFLTNVIDVAEGGSGTTFPAGLALYTAASGTEVAFIRGGTVILPSNGTVSAGALVAAAGVATGLACVGPVAATNGRDIVGQSYNAVASGGYAIVRLRI